MNKTRSSAVYSQAQNPHGCTGHLQTLHSSILEISSCYPVDPLSHPLAPYSFTSLALAVLGSWRQTSQALLLTVQYLVRGSLHVLTDDLLERLNLSVASSGNNTPSTTWNAAVDENKESGAGPKIWLVVLLRFKGCLAVEAATKHQAR